MAAPRKRALPFILPCGKFRLGCILTTRPLRNMHRNLFLPLSAGIQRVVTAHGFLCWSSDSDCLRTRMEKIYAKEKNDADQNGAL